MVSLDGSFLDSLSSLQIGSSFSSFCQGKGGAAFPRHMGGKMDDISVVVGVVVKV